MPFPRPVDRPFLSGPDHFMQQAAEKWKNSLNPPVIPLLDFNLYAQPLPLQDYKARPLTTRFDNSLQNPTNSKGPVKPPPVSLPPFEMPIASQTANSLALPPVEMPNLSEPAVHGATVPAETPIEPAIPLATPQVEINPEANPLIPSNSPLKNNPEEISMSPLESGALSQNTLTWEQQIASLVPVAKHAMKVLQHPRILGGLFVLGLLGLGYFLNQEIIRNVHITVEPDPEKKRTYRIVLDKNKHPTTIRIALAPGKPIDIKLKRPKTNEPTVYNIVVEPSLPKKCAYSEEEIDLGNRQVIRLVDKR